jgi:hypothetical protein
MSLILPRRSFLKGLIGLVMAPAVVHAENLMPLTADYSLTPVELLDACGKRIAACVARMERVETAHNLAFGTAMVARGNFTSPWESGLHRVHGARIRGQTCQWRNGIQLFLHPGQTMTFRLWDFK